MILGIAEQVSSKVHVWRGHVENTLCHDHSLLRLICEACDITDENKKQEISNTFFSTHQSPMGARKRFIISLKHQIFLLNIL